MGSMSVQRYIFSKTFFISGCQYAKCSLSDKIWLMRVLTLCRLYHPHVGGVEKHLFEINNRLVAKGMEITLVTEKFDQNLKDEETYSNTKIVRIPYPKIKLVGLLYIWLWLFKNISLIQSADIVHIHDVFIWYLPFRFLFPTKPVYTTFHGRWGMYPIPFKDIIQKRLGAKLSRGNICIGKYIPDNYGFKTDIISYGATKIPKRNFTKEQNSIVYVGRLDKDIALNNFFEVFRNIKGHEIIFCGDGELKEKCKQYGRVLGFVDPVPYYKKAKFCFASGYLTIMEALAHRCLVFTTYSHSLQKEYYQSTPFSKYIVSSAEPEEIVEKFHHYSKNTKAAEERIKKGYNWVKNQTWEKLAGQYLKLWGVGETQV
jgi:glycosyltransferase involved in cell wall biosynthesis